MRNIRLWQAVTIALCIMNAAAARAIDATGTWNFTFSPLGTCENINIVQSMGGVTINGTCDSPLAAISLSGTGDDMTGDFTVSGTESGFCNNGVYATGTVAMDSNSSSGTCICYYGVMSSIPCTFSGSRVGSPPTPTPTFTPTISATPTATATVIPACDEPISPCNGAATGGASLQLKKNLDTTKDAILWKWGHGAEIAPAVFGNPFVTTPYVVCLYDGNGTQLMRLPILPATSCNSKPCWKLSGGGATVGYKYKNSAGNDDGVRQLSVKAGPAGKGKIGLKGKGSSLNVPSLPLDLSSGALRMQLVNTTGGCWEASFSTPLTDPSDPAKFLSKNE